MIIIIFTLGTRGDVRRHARKCNQLDPLRLMIAVGTSYYTLIVKIDFFFHYIHYNLLEVLMYFSGIRIYAILLVDTY